MTGFDQVVGFIWDKAEIIFTFGKKMVKSKSFRMGAVLPTSLLDIEEEVGGWRDLGLLGFALDPNFLTNGFFYLLIPLIFLPAAI